MRGICDANTNNTPSLAFFYQLRNSTECANPTEKSRPLVDSGVANHAVADGGKAEDLLLTAGSGSAEKSQQVKWLLFKQ